MTQVAEDTEDNVGQDNDLITHALSDGSLSVKKTWALVTEFWSGRPFGDLRPLVESQVVELAHIAALVLAEMGSGVYSGVSASEREQALDLVDTLLESSHGCTVADGFDVVLCCPGERDAYFVGKLIDRAIEGTLPADVLVDRLGMLSPERKQLVLEQLSTSHRKYLDEVGFGW